ncbi:uncharacterized protein [Haliotis cracherodii]|uniref:uncharacterized protein n=1 Tax=Haliotis cracherodii TaxID=6455 RepID=UPI0039E78DC3
MDNYANLLDKVSRIRYHEKTGVIDKEDPYRIPKSKWSDDHKHLPATNYNDIVNYLVFSPSPFCSLSDIRNYRSLEAYDRFVCGWVRDIVSYVHLSVEDGKAIHIVKSKLMHSQRLNEAPLHPWFITDDTGKVLSAHCNCMAGLGESCTHVASVKFAVEAIVRLRESTTVTQEPAYWKLPALMKKVEYASLRDIDFTSSKTLKKKLDLLIDDSSATCSSSSSAKLTHKLGPASTQNFDTFLHTINADRPSCLAVHSGYSDQYVPIPLQPQFPQVIPELFDESMGGIPYDEVLEHCQNVLDQLSITEEEVTAVEAATKNQAGSPLWFQFRAGRITASKMKSASRASLFDPSRSLLRHICYPTEVKFSNPATRWGCSHEVTARDAYEKLSCEHHHNFSVEECGLFRSCEYPHPGATPDGIVDCSCCGRGCLEIKCPYCAKDDLIENNIVYLEEVNGSLQLKRDSQYYYQVQTQLFVTNHDYCDFVVWTNDIFMERITPCVAFWQPVADQAMQFFTSVILPEIVARHFLNTTCERVAPESVGEELFCTCRTPEDGSKYVGCDGKECTVRWFHFKCVGLVRKPKGKWFCKDCSSNNKGTKRKHNSEE